MISVKKSEPKNPPPSFNPMCIFFLDGKPQQVEKGEKEKTIHNILYILIINIILIYIINNNIIYIIYSYIITIFLIYRSTFLLKFREVCY